MHANREDTICAMATPMGGAIALVRVSGADAVAIVDGVFSPAGNGRPLRLRDTHTICHGTIVDSGGAVVDEVLASIFRAPRSYTGEDSVELSCHGSPYIMGTVMRILLAAGCRQATPGEFTMRAFMNGRMDLAQAEAVADVIASESAAAHRMAMGQMRGGFSRELSDLRGRLLELTSLLELELDFGDHEDLEFAPRDELLGTAARIEESISRLERSFEAGNAVRNGIPVVIAGRANVGKSTLLNALLGDDRAIVSDTPGTTRDTIEETLDIEGVTYRIIDTAGLRQARDSVEGMGIERSLRKLGQARIVLWVVDASDPGAARLDGLGDALPGLEGKRLIVVWNKVDIASEGALARMGEGCVPPALASSAREARVIGVSAKRGDRIDELKSLIASDRSLSAALSGDVVVTNARHHEALRRALPAIVRVRRGLADGASQDLLAQDLRECVRLLGEVLGDEITSAEVLESIFSRFCIGK